MAKVDYKALWEEAKQQKLEAERVMAYAERMMGQSHRSVDTTANHGDGQSPEITVDTFTGKNILQATEKYLRMVGRPARSTEEIAAALTKGGLSAGAPSVATILGRSKDSQVKRVKRGLWGLKEWYTGDK